MQNVGYLVAWHNFPGVGQVTLQKLADNFPNLKDSWAATDSQLKSLKISSEIIDQLKIARSNINPEIEFQKLIEQGIKVMTLDDADYPVWLKQIDQPPFLLYYRGNWPTGQTNLGVVGTRRATTYGKAVTQQIVGELAQQQVVIVSGLARGIDTIAHQTTVQQSAKTMAVLGGGLNQLYPAENHQLADQIIQHGGVVVSEYPPDSPPNTGNFPMRNRIIAGLSQAILVVEADIASGSLITARYALEQGRDVMAIPGPITSQFSKGTHKLIQNGAALVTSASEILDILGVRPLKRTVKTASSLSEVEKQIVELIAREAIHLDQISRQLAIPSAELSGLLVKLEIYGLVKNIGGGIYIKD